MPTTRSSKRSSEAFEMLEAPRRRRIPRDPIEYPLSPDYPSQDTASVPIPEPEPLVLPPAAAPAASEEIVPALAVINHTNAEPVLREPQFTTPFLIDFIRRLPSPNTVDAGTQTSPPPQLDAVTEKPCPTCAIASARTDEHRMLIYAHTVMEILPTPSANTNSKRARDDDSDAEHQSKRVMLTPQPQEKDNNHLWMFSSANSRVPPRSAPAKSMAPSSMRRNRGPLSKTTQYRRTSGQSAPVQMPQRITPVERDLWEKENQRNEQTNGRKIEDNSSEATISPQPARGGIFGSLRGLAANGLNLISQLSPMRPASRSQAATSKQQGPAYNNLNYQDDEESYSSLDASTGPTVEEAHNQRSSFEQPRATRPSSAYDHLHVYTPGNTPKQPLKSVPRAPPPVDPFDELKRQHPEMSDTYIRRIADKKLRERELKNTVRGLPAEGEEITVAPLFGPDSHYARGTIDPRSFLDHNPIGIAHQFQLGLSKRKRDQDRMKDKQNEDASTEEEGNSTSRVATVEDDPDDPFLDTPTAKRQRTDAPSTPRSALKKDFGASITRSGRSVLFNTNPVSGSRDLRAHYGPAGQYRGSTFADKSPPSSRENSTLSTLNEDDVISPLTQTNTNINSGIPSGRDAMVRLERNLGADVPSIDFTVRDPRNPDWRPSLGHPRPSTFCVPDFDDDDEDILDDEHTTTTTTHKPAEATIPSASTQQDTSSGASTPAQPSTPRISHAELPTSSAVFTPSSLPSNLSTGTVIGSTPININGSSSSGESTESAVEKARSAAQKYRPKDASRLSEVSTRPRSPSPEDDNETYPRTRRPTKTRTSHINDTTTSSTASNPASAPAVRPFGSAPQPFVPPILDNTIRGADGMTDHEREHQYDEWAANLDWGTPQTYEEAGIRTPEIGELIRRNWGPEDSRRSEEFWHREFDAIEAEQLEATRQGTRLEFATGMEEVNGFN